MWIDTRRAIGGARWEKPVFLETRLSGGRGSRTAKSGNGFEIRGRAFGGYKPRDRRGRLHRNMHSRLWDCGVPNVADLAMILVVGMGVSKGDRVGAQREHREDHRS